MVAFFTDIFARLAFKNTIFIAKWQRHTIVWRHFSMLFAGNLRFPYDPSLHFYVIYYAMIT